MEYQKVKQRLDERSTEQELRSAFYSPYWLKTRALTRLLLGLWVLVLLLFVVLGPRIDANWLGVPVAYWLITAVMLPIFLFLVAYYAFKMDTLDRQASSGMTEDGNQKLQSAASTAGDDINEAQQSGGKPFR